MGGYPLQLSNDPESYYSNLISILCMYAEVDARLAIADVADHCPYLPSRYDVRQACERAAGARARPLAWARAVARQLAERVEITHQRPSQTVEEVRAEMRARGLSMGDKVHTETPETARAKFGLTQEQWDALPSTKKP
jgi:hypothetical protein